MNLTTRCPSCGTAFRVQPAQLSARGGKVRCGKCGHVFDGVKALVAENAAAGAVTPAPESEPSPQLGLFEAPKRLPAAGDAANEDAPVPEFLDDTPPPRRRIGWALAALLMLAALLAQGVFYFRTEIAALVPDARPYLATACAKSRTRQAAGTARCPLAQAPARFRQPGPRRRRTRGCICRNAPCRRARKVVRAARGTRCRSLDNAS